MKSYLELVDKSTSGRRYDVTPIFNDFQAFSDLLDDLLVLSGGIEYDTIAAIDALGFILGAAIAVRSNKPLVPIRRGGKLPVEAHEASFIDYTGKEKSLEIRSDVLDASNQVLLVDEWVETAAQANAAISLIEGQGARVAAVIAINADDSEAIQELREIHNILAISQDL